METFLKIENIKLWSRVGVLDEERKLGQLFTLDIFLWTDFEKCTAYLDPVNTTMLRFKFYNDKYTLLVFLLFDLNLNHNRSYTKYVCKNWMKF